MRSFFIRIFIIGLLAILGLGGYGFYKVTQIKKEIQTTLNISLEHSHQSLSQKGWSLHFEPYKCYGLLSIECKSTRIDLYQENALFASVTNANFSLREIEKNGMTVSFKSDLKFEQNGELKAYCDILFPKNLSFTTRLLFDKENIFFTNSTFALEAKNILYKGDIKTKIVSQDILQKGLFGFLKDIHNLNSLRDQVFLQSAYFSFVSKDLNQALYEVFKGQYGNLNRQEFELFLNILVGLGSMQFSQFGLSNKILLSSINVAKELALGKRNQMELEITPNQEICLSCIKSIKDLKQLEKANFKIK